MTPVKQSSVHKEKYKMAVNSQNGSKILKDYSHYQKDMNGFAVVKIQNILRPSPERTLMPKHKGKIKRILSAIIAMFWTFLRWDMYPCDSVKGPK